MIFFTGKRNDYGIESILPRGWIVNATEANPYFSEVQNHDDSVMENLKWIVIKRSTMMNTSLLHALLFHYSVLKADKFLSRRRVEDPTIGGPSRLWRFLISLFFMPKNPNPEESFTLQEYIHDVARQIHD